MPTLLSPLFAMIMTPEAVLVMVPSLVMPLLGESAVVAMVILPELVIVTPELTSRAPSPVTTRKNLAGMAKLVFTSLVPVTVQVDGLKVHVPPKDAHTVELSEGGAGVLAA